MAAPESLLGTRVSPPQPVPSPGEALGWRDRLQAPPRAAQLYFLPAGAEEPPLWSPVDSAVLLSRTVLKEKCPGGWFICYIYFFNRARRVFAFLQTCALCLIFQKPSRCKNALSNSHVSQNFYQKLGCG